MRTFDHTFLTKLLQSKLFLLLLLCAVIISGVRLSNELARRAAITKQIRDLRTQIDDLRSERDALSSLLDTVSTDAYVEEAARKKLHVAKPGEQVIVVPLPAEAVTPEESPQSERPPALVWWDYFFANDRT